MLIGCFSVLQAGLNREIARDWGLLSAVFFNSVVVLLGASGLLFWVWLQPQAFPRFFQLRSAELSAAQLWYFVPGLCGLAIVAGFPFAIGRAGALYASVFMIGAQLLTGLVWDRVAGALPITGMRLLGIALLVAGAALMLQARR